MAQLFQSTKFGLFTLKNRVAMAPMTRSRAASGAKPTQLHVEYYRQRAGAGLIISEGTSISPLSQGFIDVPGLYSNEQVEAWRPVTRAVRAEGCVFFAQLWHVGRISHISLLPRGEKPVSSVAVHAKNATCFVRRPDGSGERVQPSKPRALSVDEIQQTVADYTDAAERAIQAGFDGVEIHGANGYLIEQFLNGGLNNGQVTRPGQPAGDDPYSGSIQARARFALEVVDAVCARIGPERTALRLSPFGRVSDMHAFEDEEETYLYLAEHLADLDLAYIHLADQLTPEDHTIPEAFYSRFRAYFPGRVILAGGYDRARAQQALDTGIADLIAFGRPFIANPDLVERMKNAWPLAERDTTTVYGGGAEGYIDYPNYQAPK